MNDFTDKYQFSEEEWKACMKVLSTLKDNPFNNPDNQQLSTLISGLYKKAKKIRRNNSYSYKRAENLQVINQSAIAQQALNNTAIYSAAETRVAQGYSELPLPRNCYSCNTSYQLSHSFYGRLCPDCAEINFSNRFKTTDLSGRNVILTGGRVKIGYATALKLLRSNANLTVTTRFPGLAMEQFMKEADYQVWKGNLTVYGLDLRSLKAIREFIDYYHSVNDSLDILINNAAQTIKYTEEYYLPMIEREQKFLTTFSSNRLLGNLHSPTKAVDIHELSNNHELDLNRFGQPVDTREKNSWNSTLEEIDMAELLEVNLINQIAPYYLIKELAGLMRVSRFAKQFIINVTSSEGQFSYENKTIFHPHTNMTKASLNMLTRTSAEEYQKYGIYMNAVDVGWVSTGAREALRQKQFNEGYIPPLDPVDGASRIMVPIINGIENEDETAGKLWKNYKIVDW